MKKYFILLIIVCFGIYLYPGILPDHGGDAACTKALGWKPTLYGAEFQKQYYPNGVFLYNAGVYRYKMNYTNFRAMRQELSKKGWIFDEDEKYGSKANGCVTNYYYPMRGKVIYGYTASRKCPALFYCPSTNSLYFEHWYGSR